MTSLRWLLFASLAVNVFVLGAAAGGGLAGLRLVHRAELERPAPAPKAGGLIDPRLVFDALDETRKRELRREIRSTFRTLGPQLRKVSGAREELLDALQADPFDEARARRAYETLVQKYKDVRETGYDQLFEVLVSLTPEERQRIVAALRDSEQRLWMGRGRPGRKGGVQPDAEIAPPPPPPGDAP